MATTDFSKFRESGELSDINVAVDGKDFKLHKFPLFIKSDFFRALARTNVVEKDKVELEDFPGGAATFEDVANYCYNIKIELTKDNVCKLRCAAEFLQMNCPGNLAEGADRFLMDILTSAKLSRDIKGISQLLLQCKELGAISEQAKIVDKCVMAIVDCWLLSTKFSQPETSSVEWWSNDLQTKKILYQIPLAWFVLLFTTARDKGVKPDVLADLVQSYTTFVIRSKLSDENKGDDEATQEEVKSSKGKASDEDDDEEEEEEKENATDEKDVGTPVDKEEQAEKQKAEGEDDDDNDDDYKSIEEEAAVEKDTKGDESPTKEGKSAEHLTTQTPEVVSYDIPEDEIVKDLEVAVTLDTLIAELPDNVLLADCISPRWSLRVLKIAEANECSCTEQLRKLVSRVVHRLSSEELCQLSADVLAEIVCESCKDEDRSHRQMACTLVDDYLSELAAREKLTVETFNKMVAAIPDDYRFSHDTLFQVMEALLNSANPGGNKVKLTDEQRERLVASIDYTRLSESSLQRAYETELVPPTHVTKAALALCSKLRAELVEARAVIKSQERELEKYTFRGTSSKYATRSSSGKSHGGRIKNADKYSRELESITSPRVRTYDHLPSSYSTSYSSPYVGLPTLASESELKMALDSLERTPHYSNFEVSTYTPSEAYSYRSSLGYGSYLDDHDSLVESDSYFPRNRLGYTGKPDPWPYRY